MISVLAAAAVAVTPIPRADVGAACAATTHNNPIPANRCVIEEQGAYDTVRVVWPVVPEDVRKLCVRVASRRLTAAWTYTVLASCLADHVDRIVPQATFRGW